MRPFLDFRSGLTAAKCEPKATPPEPDGSIALEGKIRQTETEGGRICRMRGSRGSGK